MSHTLCSCCIQDTPGTVAPLPHTGDTELTTPQEDIADKDEAETTTVSASMLCNECGNTLPPHSQSGSTRATDPKTNRPDIP